MGLDNSGFGRFVPSMQGWSTHLTRSVQKMEGVAWCLLLCGGICLLLHQEAWSWHTFGSAVCEYDAVWAACYEGQRQTALPAQNQGNFEARSGPGVRVRQ